MLVIVLIIIILKKKKKKKKMLVAVSELDTGVERHSPPSSDRPSRRRQIRRRGRRTQHRHGTEGDGKAMRVATDGRMGTTRLLFRVLLVLVQA